MLARVAIYAVIILVAVGIGLFLLSDVAPPKGGGFAGGPSPSVPATPWKPSAKQDAAANDGFRVDLGRKENAALAGTNIGTDWPQFNGALRDNRSAETGLLKSWPPDGPPLAWTAHGVGVGYSTVAVVNGVIYTMGNKGDSEAILALDAGTGEKLWSTPFAWASHPSNGDGPRSTPAVHEGRVFGLGANGDLVCVAAADGKIAWQKNIAKDYGASAPGWGYCESLLIDEQRLIATPGGDKATLVALKPDTGEELWRVLLDGKDRPGYASAAFAELGGVRQYVQFTSAGTVGVRADTGKFLWRDNSSANGSANCSSPLISGDLVFTASNYGTGGALVRISPQGNAELVYKTSNMMNHHGDMAIVDGLLFGSHDPGVLTCLELETGAVKWKNRSVGKGAVTYADGRIYLRSEQGPVALVEATGDGYHELGQFDQPRRSSSSAWAHPVVAAGRLFLRDADVLLCYDLREQ